MKKTAPRLPIWQQAIVAVLAASISAGVAYYLSWQWIALPQNEQRFAQTINNNANHYSEKTQTYLTALNNTLSAFAREVPSTLLTPTLPSSHAELFIDEANNQNNETLIQIAPKKNQKTVQQWLAEKKVQWQTVLPEARSFAIFSSQEIETMTSSLRFGREEIANTLVEYGVSFLFLDMVNRLNDGEAVHVEVAKVAGSHQWQLHHIEAIKSGSANTQGVLYTILTIDELYQSWGIVNPLLGRITLQQKVNQGAPLDFLSVGQADRNTYAITIDIPESYWQITYVPSEVLQKNQRVTPTIIWLIAALSFFVVLGMYAWYLRHTYRSLKPTKAANVASKNTPVEADKKAPINQTVTGIHQNIDKSLVTERSRQDPVEKNETNESLIIPETIFRAYDIRGIAHEELSLELVFAIGRAYATEVLLAGDTSVVVGWDARLHSQEFSVCLMEGIHSTGCHTLPLGVVPTPLMNFTAHTHSETSSGIIVTASHNPKEYNGCKMVIKGQTLVDDDIQRLKNRIVSNDFHQAPAEKGQSSTIDFSQDYIDKVISDVAVIDGWNVVVDTANGASSELAPRLLNALQCQTHLLFGQFDGDFPNHDPDPSVEKNLQTLIDTVKEKQADIGFALDGDGDRLVAVTGSGKILWPDQLMMLFAQDIVSRNPGCDVVFDIKCSQLLAQTISEHGGRPVMWKTGHSHIKSKMQETQALLGGEFSGHIFFKERWYGFDDGLYAAARFLELMTLSGKTADELLAELPVRFSTPEIKISVPEEKKFELIKQLVAHAEFDNGQKITIDGLRVEFPGGWGLVRASNTAAALTLRFEAEDKETLDRIKQQFYRALKSIDDNIDVE